jgi:hypothetical protein
MSTRRADDGDHTPAAEAPAADRGGTAGLAGLHRDGRDAPLRAHVTAAGERNSFAETDDAALLDAAHQYLKAPIVAHLFGQTLTATSEVTRATLGWPPSGPTLVEDILAGAYS